MSKPSEYTSNHGMGLAGWLTLLFVGLKLTGYINWSWWWVFAPIWGVALIILVVVGVVALVAYGLGK